MREGIGVKIYLVGFLIGAAAVDASGDEAVVGVEGLVVPTDGDLRMSLHSRALAHFDEAVFGSLFELSKMK